MSANVKLLSAACAAICVALLTVPAAAEPLAKSSVTLKVASGPPFHGRVTSKNPACIPNRRVALIEVAPQHAFIDYADNRTNGKGKYVWSSQLQGARVVQAKVIQSKASGVTCGAAVSAPKTLY